MQYFVLKIHFWFVLSVCLSAVGCNTTRLPEGMPKPYPVTITILQDGKALEGASVTMIPLDSAISQWIAGGGTNASGEATIVTFGKYKGAVPGNYKVLISKIINERDESKRPADINSQEFQKWYSGATVIQLVNLRFTDDSTPEQMEVIKGKNKKTIDVGAEIRTILSSPQNNN
jgi:hypothetical protein